MIPSYTDLYNRLNKILERSGSGFSNVFGKEKIITLVKEYKLIEKIIEILKREVDEFSLSIKISECTIFKNDYLKSERFNFSDVRNFEMKIGMIKLEVLNSYPSTEKSYRPDGDYSFNNYIANSFFHKYRKNQDPNLIESILQYIPYKSFFSGGFYTIDTLRIDEKEKKNLRNQHATEWINATVPITLKFIYKGWYDAEFVSGNFDQFISNHRRTYANKEIINPTSIDTPIKTKLTFKQFYYFLNKYFIDSEIFFSDLPPSQQYYILHLFTGVTPSFISKKGKTKHYHNQEKKSVELELKDILDTMSRLVEEYQNTDYEAVVNSSQNLEKEIKEYRQTNKSKKDK